jgi:UDP-N-acetyl-D-galactosamine dehydrogenase
MNKKDFSVAVIGIGYVGLPLAMECSENGFYTIGYDHSKIRIDELKRGFDATNTFNSESLLKNNKLKFSNSEKDIRNANFFIITVPTPIDSNNTPDLRYLIAASKLVGKYLKKNDIVVYESTVYPGATEDVCIPILEETSSLKLNRDFGCGYSPERINPGDTTMTLKNITKVISSSNKTFLPKIKFLYSSIVDAGIFVAKNIKTAEAAKVIENTQRDLNIALMNELSKIFNLLGIKTLDVIEAAKTKWNFAHYLPGLVGGHCIGVDPYYLTHKAQSLGYNPEIILAGRRINATMHEYVREKVIEKIFSSKLNLKNATLLFLGMTFKENCNDIRNSKSIDLVQSFAKLKISLFHSDPMVDSLKINGSKHLKYSSLFRSNLKFDVIILVTPHDLLLKDESRIRKLLKNKNSFIFDIKGKLSDSKNSYGAL